MTFPDVYVRVTDLVATTGPLMTGPMRSSLLQAEKRYSPLESCAWPIAILLASVQTHFIGHAAPDSVVSQVLLPEASMSLRSGFRGQAQPLSRSNVKKPFDAGRRRLLWYLWRLPRDVRR